MDTNRAECKLDNDDVEMWEDVRRSDHLDVALSRDAALPSGASDGEVRGADASFEPPMCAKASDASAVEVAFAADLVLTIILGLHLALWFAIPGALMAIVRGSFCCCLEWNPETRGPFRSVSYVLKMGGPVLTTFVLHLCLSGWVPVGLLAGLYAACAVETIVAFRCCSLGSVESARACVQYLMQLVPLDSMRRRDVMCVAAIQPITGVPRRWTWWRSVWHACVPIPLHDLYAAREAVSAAFLVMACMFWPMGANVQWSFTCDRIWTGPWLVLSAIIGAGCLFVVVKFRALVNECVKSNGVPVLQDPIVPTRPLARSIDVDMLANAPHRFLLMRCGAPSQMPNFIKPLATGLLARALSPSSTVSCAACGTPWFHASEFLNRICSDDNGEELYLVFRDAHHPTRREPGLARIKYISQSTYNKPVLNEARQHQLMCTGCASFVGECVHIIKKTSHPPREVPTDKEDTSSTESSWEYWIHFLSIDDGAPRSRPPAN